MLRNAAILLAALSGAANAETLTCPVGGERFEAPAAPHCGEITGQSMLLMPIGCPPDPMPQCPQNFLPMYKAFSVDEMPLLTQYMQSESYESLVDFSPFYLAYTIEKYLNGPDKALPLRILQRGLRHDPMLLNSEPGYLPALSAEFGAYISGNASDENTTALAQLAFFHVLGADITRAGAYLERAESERARGAAVLRYLSAVRRCVNDPSELHCSATAAIPAR